MTQTARFWDRTAAKYAARPIADEDAYRRKLAITRRYLTPESDVLEFGCGTGSTALEHAPHVRSIRATDLSPRMIEIAQSKADATGAQNVRFEVATLDTLDAAPASFDAVLGLNILHLLDDWPAQIAKAQALLKPGGVFVTSTACLGDRHNWLRLVLPLARIVGKAPPVAFFTEKRFKAQMTGAGFEIVEEWRPDMTLFLVARKPL